MIGMGSIIGAGASVVSGLFGGSKAKAAARAAAAEKARLQGKLNSLETNRQDIVNPYAGVVSLASMASDLSNQISNPFANLSVATGAAEMKIEQADISLANTLDTVRATGAGAGGATALAQAALQSKKGVAASIESQEAQNEKLRAQGEQQMEQAQVAQKARLENIQISEGGRAQQAQGQGESFKMQMTENRQQDQVDYTRGLLAQATANQAQATADATSSTMGAISSAGSLLGGLMG
jgi:hypothetical protein|tara:strand:+ start:242 stop:955 length:714 start_codon:yes stop_codon:yes gene_type:complete